MMHHVATMKFVSIKICTRYGNRGLNEPCKDSTNCDKLACKVGSNTCGKCNETGNVHEMSYAYPALVFQKPIGRRDKHAYLKKTVKDLYNVTKTLLVKNLLLLVPMQNAKIITNVTMLAQPEKAATAWKGHVVMMIFIALELKYVIRTKVLNVRYLQIVKPV